LLPQAGAPTLAGLALGYGKPVIRLVHSKELLRLLTAKYHVASGYLFTASAA